MVARFLSIKPLVGIGLLSYSIYLWHQPLLSFLRHSLLSEPNNFQFRFDLALSLVKNSQNSEAIDHLLEIFKRDRDWNDEQAKKTLLSIFDTMKPDDPLVLKSRRKLSSLIFN